MKTLFFALLSLSLSVSASEIDVTEALTQSLPLGTYSGESLKTHGPCQLTLKKSSRGILVLVSADHMKLTREIEFGSAYRWRPGTRELLSSERAATNDGMSESVFRTIAVKENTQYVVVSKREVTNRDSFEVKIECVINL